MAILTISDLCDWAFDYFTQVYSEKYLNDISEILIELCKEIAKYNYDEEACRIWATNLFRASMNIDDMLKKWQRAVSEAEIENHRNSLRKEQLRLLTILKKFDRECSWPNLPKWIDHRTDILAKAIISISPNLIDEFKRLAELVEAKLAYLQEQCNLLREAEQRIQNVSRKKSREYYEEKIQPLENRIERISDVLNRDQELSTSKEEPMRKAIRSFKQVLELDNGIT